ncbi:YbaK/ProRS associated domain-containing protein [Rhizoclosmatium globosum]|uniref:YbaK/ProRS associated domain-containing protein n=1 Tax=Rhizoclosmatium globosum TaxID=329046 RepID=A0A1Y2BX24_9FUNG|nr:YbaK/ProRS associated domain-containing protein [Rhizoclosmatium globosum]|eukprot:ORY39320.1 YbaK/ProRS associated domain-containing protein [Rhizoclosmatium globosum]
MPEFVWSAWQWQPVKAAADKETVEVVSRKHASYDHEAVVSQIHKLANAISVVYSSPSVQDKYMKHWKQKALEEKEAGQIMKDAPESALRVEKGAADIGLRDVIRIYQVERDYYTWPLERRMLRMNAPSINHLCKTLFFENTRYVPGQGDILDPTNSKYYVVVVQYTGKLNSTKLTNFVRALSNGTKKNFNLRVASEAESDEYTGYKTGGVTPFGMARKVPIILSQAITELAPRVFFMGCGHVDWKIACPVDDFVKATGCYVVDLD